jgi:hypothetical protein
MFLLRTLNRSSVLGRSCQCADGTGSEAVLNTRLFERADEGLECVWVAQRERGDTWVVQMDTHFQWLAGLREQTRGSCVLLIDFQQITKLRARLHVVVCRASAYRPLQPNIPSIFYTFEEKRKERRRKRKKNTRSNVLVWPTRFNNRNYNTSKFSCLETRVECAATLLTLPPKTQLRHYFDIVDSLEFPLTHIRSNALTVRVAVSTSFGTSEAMLCPCCDVY